MRAQVGLGLFVVLSCNCQGNTNHHILTHSRLEEGERNYIHNKIQTFLANDGNVDLLPVHARSKRPSKSCLDVLEEEILYK